MDNDVLLLKIKELFDTKIDEVKVLVENLESKIQIVAEGHDTLNTKIDEVKQDTNDLKVSMNTIKDYVIGVDAKLNEHEIMLKRVK